MYCTLYDRCSVQSHYREVALWEISISKTWASFEPIGNTEKNLRPIMSKF